MNLPVTQKHFLSFSRKLFLSVISLFLVFAICFIAYWVIGLPLGFVLARTNVLAPLMGAQGFWIAYIVALGFGALCYLLRVRFLHGLAPEAILLRVRR